MKSLIKPLLFNLALLTWLVLAIPVARGQGTAFTYNGRLNVNGIPATGSYDLSFTLYTAATNGPVVGALTNAATPVTNGLFTVTLDFGGVFNGSNYWLGIAARTNGVGTFTTLSPLQPLTPTPYAIYAENAASAVTAASANSVAGANITGTVPLAGLPAAVLTNNQTGVTLSGTFNGDGGGLTNVPATGLAGIIPDSLLSSNIARLDIPNTNIQATASVINTLGFITGTTNLTSGSGYTNDPLVTVSDVTGSNAVITATVANGTVTSLTVQTAGINYSTNATLTIAPPPDSGIQTFANDISFAGANTFNNPSNLFAGSFTGDGTGLSNVITGPVGLSALESTANGYQALAANTSGYNNTANGYLALLNNTNGYTGIPQRVKCGHDPSFSEGI